MTFDGGGPYVVILVGTAALKEAGSGRRTYRATGPIFEQSLAHQWLVPRQRLIFRHAEFYRTKEACALPCPLEELARQFQTLALGLNLQTDSGGTWRASRILRGLQRPLGTTLGGPSASACPESGSKVLSSVSGKAIA